MTDLATTVRIGLVLTVVVVLVSSVLFGRYDWTGLPLVRALRTDVKVVDENCTELIRPYTTESGRVVEPVVSDEMQYMAMVLYYRGVPKEDLQVQCFYDPWVYRSGTSWLAHLLPFEEGVSLSVVNLLMTVLGLWFVVLALRWQGYGPRVVLAGGLLYAVSWNVFFFGAALLVDASVVAAVALCWYLLCRDRPWLVWPVLLLGYPLKETVGVVVPVMAVWAWIEVRAGRRNPVGAAAPTLAAAVAFAAGVVWWRGVLPEPDAAWPVSPNVDSVVWNLTNGPSLVALVAGIGPLLALSILSVRRRAHCAGWWPALVDPAVTGVVVVVAVNAWSLITVKTSPRLFWIAFPFAISLAARWLSEGRPRAWLDGLRIPGLPAAVPA